ncbi:MAG TPA: thioredoxin domain-containing protein, partial [Gemmatimonadaceae bacterium]|nr:thioredoxin domain-containing protein [Gemmatimonadaceae bacterium]
FVACLRDPRTAETVERLHQLARQLNVRVAPTFFVNGRRVEGAVPLDAARSVLDVALSSQ